MTLLYFLAFFNICVFHFVVSLLCFQAHTSFLLCCLFRYLPHPFYVSYQTLKILTLEINVLHFKINSMSLLNVLNISSSFLNIWGTIVITASLIIYAISASVLIDGHSFLLWVLFSFNAW